MTFLGGADLQARLARDLKIEPAPSHAPVWDIDLRMGPEAFVSTWDEIRQLGEGQSFKIEPGAFALLLTEETLTFPDDLIGFISLKFKWKLKGLANVSGFHVDPLYHGRLVFAVYNSGPRDVVLRQGSDLFMLGVANLKKAVKSPPKRSYDRIPPELATDLKGPPVSVIQLDSRIRNLEATLERRRTVSRAMWGLVGAFVVGVGATLVTQWLARL